MAQAHACAVALVGWVPGESDTEARVARADDKDPRVRVFVAALRSITRQIGCRSRSIPVLDPCLPQLREGGLARYVRDDLEASSAPVDPGRRRGAAPGGADAS